MAYANMVIAGGGADGFAERAAAAGAAGVIVPDLPLGEAEYVRDSFAAAGLASVPLIAPTTPEARRRAIAGAASGFVYLVSDVGTTGEREALPSGLTGLVESVRAGAGLPVAVGFGIGTPEQVAAVGEVADGVIVGSRLVRAVAEAASPREGADAAREFLRRASIALCG
jgi:tryptophan synthase alpha chain